MPEFFAFLFFLLLFFLFVVLHLFYFEQNWKFQILLCNVSPYISFFLFEYGETILGGLLETFLRANLKTDKIILLTVFIILKKKNN